MFHVAACMARAAFFLVQYRYALVFRYACAACPEGSRHEEYMYGIQC